MSFNNAISFKDFIKDKASMVLPNALEPLDEGAKKVLSGIIDTHWDGVIADFFYKNATNKLIPISNIPPIPKVTTADWQLGGARDVFMSLLDVTKAGIGRGEVALFWAYNFRKNGIPNQYLSGNYFDWTKPLRKKYQKEIQEYIGTLRGKKKPSKEIIKHMSSDGGRDATPEDVIDFCHEFMTTRTMLGVSQGVKLSVSDRFLLDRRTGAGARENNDKGDGADLIIGKVAVEVKAYKSSTAKIKIGMISDEGAYQPIKMIESLFGFHNLFAAFTGNDRAEQYMMNNFHGYQFKSALASFQAVREILLGKTIPKKVLKMPVFVSLKKVMDEVEDQINDFAKNEWIKIAKMGNLMKKLSADPSEALNPDSNNAKVGAIICKAIILNKLGTKPGQEGWFFNVDQQKRFMWHKIEFDKITDEVANLEKINLTGGNLFMNFKDIEIQE